MDGPVVVFLGPTLPVEDAAGLLAAIYLPPAENGSLLRAVRDHQPATIAIVDGVFARRAPLRHKEILWALALGIDVHGAASMGALRAAELHPFGMAGTGFVYRWYRGTPGGDDDEVAVAMTPAGLGSRPLGEALIDMRLTFRLARRLGVIGRDGEAALARWARAVYFVERRYETVVAAARQGENSALLQQFAAFEAWLPSGKVEQKRRDAIALLTGLARRGPVPRRRRAPFVLTEAWAAELDEADLESVFASMASFRAVG